LRVLHEVRVGEGTNVRVPKSQSKGTQRMFLEMTVYPSGNRIFFFSFV